jgi:hypothetical protein
MKSAIANVTRLTERPIDAGDRAWLTFPAQAAIVLTR